MKISKLLIAVILFCGVMGFCSCSHIHKLSEWNIEKYATCSEEGKMSRFCTIEGCDFLEVKPIKKEEHMPVIDQEILPTCASVGYTEGSHCKKCNTILIQQTEVAKIDNHSFVDGICLVCNSTKQLLQKEFDSELPTFFIHTNGATIPDRSHPNYKDYAECEITMFNGDVKEFGETAKIRIRGTSSRWFEKKGYKLKFSSAKELEGLPNSKKYNLLASYMDPCKLRDYLALSISYTMNNNSDRYAPIPILSKVYIDDKYMGLYFLVDDVDSGSRKIELKDYTEQDVEIPFILEMDTVAYKEGIEGQNYFALGRTDVFDYDGDGWTDLLYVIDSDDNLTSAQFNYVKNYITSCRQSLVDKDLEKFKQLVDINSFIDYFLLGELFRNTDMAGRSVYMYRESSNSKLVFGPSWDFDYTCSRPYQLGPNVDFTLENAKDRFTNYDWWMLFLDIPGAEQLIKQRYTIYLRDIFVHEIESAKQFYLFYQDEIKEDASIWFNDDVDDTNKLVEDNFKWTSDYFVLRIEMLDELFLIQQ